MTRAPASSSRRRARARARALRRAAQVIGFSPLVVALGWAVIIIGPGFFQQFDRLLKQKGLQPLQGTSKTGR